MIFEARKNVKIKLSFLSWREKVKKDRKNIALDLEVNESPIPTPHKAMW